jgi:hypothetical protein
MSILSKMPSATVKMSHTPHGGKKVEGGVEQKKRTGFPTVSGFTGYPKPKQKATAAVPSSSRAIRPKPTIAQGTAAMSKGATPAMKKGALDRQSAFVTDSLYECLEKLGVTMELEDSSFIFYFYHTYLKTHLEREIDLVRGMKTGGVNAPHLCHYTPLNKHLQVSPDVVELSQDIRSLAQMKFYKMLIFRVMEATNKALRDAAFKGKIYLKKNFYSQLQGYWQEAVEPLIIEEKERKRAQEEEEEEESEPKEPLEEDEEEGMEEEDIEEGGGVEGEGEEASEDS